LEVEFEARVSKMSNRFYLAVPKKLNPMFARLHGRTVRVRVVAEGLGGGEGGGG